MPREFHQQNTHQLSIIVGCVTAAPNAPKLSLNRSTINHQPSTINHQPSTINY
ncbi:MAG: hypothetical protein DSM107014_11760 [Gomphosphaeria aponina SAG 52.96 = DSM 107014]|uniref:Uncharacterized protein n=1 Tax=Gomphosphaeria aponina SAG 52.96 = DSM 107014 TaxID=1521640 RepID=A0A941JQ61_9CHRO|nr:hypothetical protein [Gomphosphaeria aponina SAG 52.96 = DSM 107014]